MSAPDLPKTLSEAQREITRLRASLSAPTTPDTKTVERVAAAMWSVNGFDFSYEEAKKDAAAGEKGHIREIEWAYDMACAAIAAMPDTKPTHWAVTSASGMHIGLWDNFDTAKKVFDSEPAGSAMNPMRSIPPKLSGDAPDTTAQADTIKALVDALEWYEKHRLDAVYRVHSIIASEDEAVKLLCERHGYGAVMDSAARQWAKKPHGAAAFFIGGCIGDETAKDAIAAAKEPT